MAPLTMYEERNTGTNLPAEIKISAVDGDAYKFLFIAKGGGSANKSYLFQETKALLNEESLLPWLFEKLQALGTAACPPYHLAVVIGVGGVRRGDRQAGLDALSRLAADNRLTGRPASVTSTSKRKVLDLSQRTGIGAQFGEVLLPRRAGSSACPATGELPSGDGGVLLSRSSGARQDHPGRRLPRTARARWRSSCSTSPTSFSTTPTSCALTSPVRWTRSSPPSPPTRCGRVLMLTGPMVVARDIAHAKIKRLDAGEPMPQYLRDHCVYYAPGQRRHRRAMRRARSGRRQRGGWTATSTSSKQQVVRW